MHTWIDSIHILYMTLMSTEFGYYTSNTSSTPPQGLNTAYIMLILPPVLHTKYPIMPPISPHMEYFKYAHLTGN